MTASSSSRHSGFDETHHRVLLGDGAELQDRLAIEEDPRPDNDGVELRLRREPQRLVRRFDQIGGIVAPRFDKAQVDAIEFLELENRNLLIPLEARIRSFDQRRTRRRMKISFPSSAKLSTMPSLCSSAEPEGRMITMRGTIGWPS